MHETQRKSPRKSEQRNKAKNQPRVFPVPFSIELERQHAVASHHASNQDKKDTQPERMRQFICPRL
jgi:hypothetical protein